MPFDTWPRIFPFLIFTLPAIRELGSATITLIPTFTLGAPQTI